MPEPDAKRPPATRSAGVTDTSPQGPPPSPPPSGANRHGSYNGAGVDGGVTRCRNFAAWAGLSDLVALEFSAYSSWADVEGPAWNLSPWDGQGITVVYSPVAWPNGVGGNLATAASGAYDSHWTTLAQHLALYDVHWIMRPAYETGSPTGGNWFEWQFQTSGEAANYKTYFQRIVTAMRAVTPGLEFVFNGLAGDTNIDQQLAYPGASYVNYIGFDFYDYAYSISNVVTRWNFVRDADNGLTWWSSLAASEGKPIGIPEWGTWATSNGGGGDNPYYIEQMHAWMAANNTSWDTYFNVSAPDGDHKIFPNPTAFPLAAAKYVELFS